MTPLQQTDVLMINPFGKKTFDSKLPQEQNLEKQFICKKRDVKSQVKNEIIHSVTKLPSLPITISDRISNLPITMPPSVHTGPKNKSPSTKP